MKKLLLLSVKNQPKNRLESEDKDSPLRQLGTGSTIMNLSLRSRQEGGKKVHQVEATKKRWQLISEELGDEIAVEEINILLRSEDHTTAFSKLRELTGKDVNNAHINVVTGLVAMTVGNKEVAANYFSRALQSDPNDANALHNSAVLAISK